MTDLIARLRDVGFRDSATELCEQAADRIEQQAARIAALEGALREARVFYAGPERGLAMIDAALSGEQPSSHVLVPREPTAQMMIAGAEARTKYCLDTGEGLVHDPLTEVSEVYSAMVAAGSQS